MSDGTLAWARMDGLLPAIVQDADSGRVLMLGYMNEAALAASRASGFVTFYSRSKRRLWQKGETSGNRLALVRIAADCDGDALLVEAVPAGPTCHTGSLSCFGGETQGPGWLGALERIVAARAGAGTEASYTARLLAAGPEKIAQKVGEEGVEVALAAVARDRDGVIAECADLAYHLTVLMRARDFGWADVMRELQARHADSDGAAAGSS